MCPNPPPHHPPKTSHSTLSKGKSVSSVVKDEYVMLKCLNEKKLKQHPNVWTKKNLKTHPIYNNGRGPEGAISWQHFQQFHVRSKGSLGILVSLWPNIMVQRSKGWGTNDCMKLPFNTLIWECKQSAKSTNCWWVALWVQLKIQATWHSHKHKSTSNISLTAQMKWDHNLPKKKWKDRQVLFIGILIVKGQLHIRQFETLFWWHRLWCLGVCWRKWMHFS